MRFRPLAAIAVLGLVAACAVPFQSRVVRFNQLVPQTAGGTFTVAPRDLDRQGSIEFQMYAQEVSRRLEAEGFRSAAAAESANFVVTLDYGTNQGRDRIETRGGFGPSFGYGYGGFGYGGFGRYGYRRGYYGVGYGGFYDPFWGGFGGFGGFGGWDYPEVYSFTEYTSFVDVDIRRANSGEAIFEGRAETDSRSKDLPRLVPNLVQAMFTGFPGRSGETVRVAIDDKGRATESVRRY